MSVTGKGCEKCNYTGRVAWDASPTVAWVTKPCDHCGGLSQFVPPPDYRALCVELVAALESLKRTEHDECEDGFFSCPKAPGYFGSDLGDRCYCGMDRTNAIIDAALAKAARVMGG
jgi:hypothetical protein